MEIQVAFDETLDCVVGRLEGELNLAAAKEYIGKIVPVAKKHPCHRFLNDIRKAIITLSVVDIYYLPEYGIAKGFDERWRRACWVGSTTDMEKVNFFETVASNLGLMVKVFHDVDKALEWLHSNS